ncbi:unnamed protein product [Musa hybrid cultivar]
MGLGPWAPGDLGGWVQPAKLILTDPRRPVFVPGTLHLPLAGNPRQPRRLSSLLRARLASRTTNGQYSSSGGGSATRRLRSNTSKGRVSMGTEKFMFSSPRNRGEPNKQDEEASEELTEEDLEHALADITFQDLQRARADGSHRSHATKLHQQLKPSRANKNRPMEMSSKMRVGRFREVIQAPKKVVRDPRFESLCGTLDTDGFRKRYSFLFEVELPAEKERLQKLIRKSKDPNAVEELKSHLSWIDEQIKSGPRKCAESEILSEHIKKEREAAKRGKQPYYLKKSEIRERKLIQKYNELKAAGKLDSYIEKRQKKNASKDHRYMPYRRSGNDAQE